MLSDKWLQLEYTHGESIDIVEGLIDYYIWTDNFSTPIGVSLNFEYADDVHYELHYCDWVRFLKDCLHTDPYNCSEALNTFFSESDCFAFDDMLINNDITYNRVAFYNPGDFVWE